jgi:SagB-type dehydrogenase family enzyme
MTWMLSAEPTPRKAPGVCQPSPWPNGKVERLAPPRHPRQSFCDVVNARRSRRTFAPLGAVDLSTLLWLSARVVASEPSPLGVDLSLRPVPSAGALHPIHILLCGERDNRWRRYDPISHALVDVEDGSISVASARLAVNPAVAVGEGTLIWLVAEPGRTAAKYENGEGLIWRESGAILSQLGLVSSLLGLHYCSLGLTGSDWMEQSGQLQLFRGVGLAIVGAPPGGDIAS